MAADGDECRYYVSVHCPQVTVSFLKDERDIRATDYIKKNKFRPDKKAILTGWLRDQPVLNTPTHYSHSTQTHDIIRLDWDINLNSLNSTLVDTSLKKTPSDWIGTSSSTTTQQRHRQDFFLYFEKKKKKEKLPLRSSHHRSKRPCWICSTTPSAW